MCSMEHPPAQHPVPTTPAEATRIEHLNAYRITSEPWWERGGDGYDRMELAQAKGRYHAVGNWGKDGWDCLEWPYYICYTRTVTASTTGLTTRPTQKFKHSGLPVPCDVDMYDVTTDCEGDIDSWTFPTRELQYRFIDLLCLANWERKREEWVAGYTVGDEPPAHLTGPFSWDRVDLSEPDEPTGGLQE